MKIFLAIALLGIATIVHAETLTFPSLRIEVEDDWAYYIDKGSQDHSELGALINIYHPNGNGVLRIQSYSAPNVVNRGMLRSMTNVDSAITLDWQKWGDYFGFLYDYSEGDSFYRQWWLVNERTIIFIVYDSSVESNEIEIEEINKIVNSITVNNS